MNLDELVGNTSKNVKLYGTELLSKKIIEQIFDYLQTEVISIRIDDNEGCIIIENGVDKK